VKTTSERGLFSKTFAPPSPLWLTLHGKGIETYWAHFKQKFSEKTEVVFFRGHAANLFFEQKRPTAHVEGFVGESDALWPFTLSLAVSLGPSFISAFAHLFIHSLSDPLT